MFGNEMVQLFPDGLQIVLEGEPSDYGIYAGGYAVVGAAAFS
eukprot:SAG31_NODE_40467_length_280_cov_1.320442_1_plen_41_part_01